MSGRNLPLIGTTSIVAIVFFLIGQATNTEEPDDRGDTTANQSPTPDLADVSPADPDPAPSADWTALLSEENLIQTIGSSAESLDLEAKLRAWAEENPLAALAFAKEQVEPASEVRKMLRAVLDVWAHNDPLAAWTWAEDDSHFHLNRLLKVMGKVAPELAWEKAQTFANKEELANIENIGYLSAIRGMLYQGQHAEAIDLFQNSEITSIHEKRGEENRFLETIINDWALYEPEEALAWANSLDEDSVTEKATALKIVIDTWAYTDPEQVLALANETSDPALAENALSSGIFQLSQQQPEKAIAWLAGKETQPAFDDAYQNLALNTRLLQADPVRSFMLMASITDQELSGEGIIKVGEEWFQQDPVAAEQFFKENTTMNEEELAELAKQARTTREDMARERTYDGWD